jgi:hypothetical protein
MLRRAALLAAVILFTGCLHTNTVPPPAPGADGPRLEAAYQPPFYTGPGNVGAFRTECELSFTAPVDPIVYPGQGDLDAGPSHDHNFFGPTWHDGFTTDPTGAPASTCYGGTLNRTAYWSPAMVDTTTNNGSNEFDMVQPATGPWTLPLQVYYKSGYGGVASRDVQTFPVGLKIVAGNPNSTGPQRHVVFDCIASGDAQSYVDGIVARPSIPTDCPPGRIIQVRLTFPQCWNGSDLWLPGSAHMAYPTLAEGCPSSHPVALTEIIEHFRYRVGPNGSAGYRFVTDSYDPNLYPGGYSFHGDWFNGWHQPTLDRIVDDCIANEHDCRMNLIGFTGQALAYPVP